MKRPDNELWCEPQKEKQEEKRKIEENPSITKNDEAETSEKASPNAKRQKIIKVLAELSQPSQETKPSENLSPIITNDINTSKEKIEKKDIEPPLNIPYLNRIGHFISGLSINLFFPIPNKKDTKQSQPSNDKFWKDIKDLIRKFTPRNQSGKALLKLGPFNGGSIQITAEENNSPLDLFNEMKKNFNENKVTETIDNICEEEEKPEDKITPNNIQPLILPPKPIKQKPKPKVQTKKKKNNIYLIEENEECINPDAEYGKKVYDELSTLLKKILELNYSSDPDNLRSNISLTSRLMHRYQFINSELINNLISQSPTIHTIKAIEITTLLRVLNFQGRTPLNETVEKIRTAMKAEEKEKKMLIAMSDAIPFKLICARDKYSEEIYSKIFNLFSTIFSKNNEKKFLEKIKQKIKIHNHYQLNLILSSFYADIENRVSTPREITKLEVESLINVLDEPLCITYRKEVSEVIQVLKEIDKNEAKSYIKIPWVGKLYEEKNQKIPTSSSQTSASTLNPSEDTKKSEEKEISETIQALIKIKEIETNKAKPNIKTATLNPSESTKEFEEKEFRP